MAMVHVDVRLTDQVGWLDPSVGTHQMNQLCALVKASTLMQCISHCPGIIFLLPQPLDGCWCLLCQGSGYFSQPRSLNILPDVGDQLTSRFHGRDIFREIGLLP